MKKQGAIRQMKDSANTLKKIKIAGKDYDYRDEVKSIIQTKLTFQQRVRLFFGSSLMIGTTTYFKYKVAQVAQTAGVTVGPWKKARVLVVTVILLVILSVVLFSCSKAEANYLIPVECRTVTIYFDALDEEGNVIDSWVGWTAPRVCGEDLARFKAMPPQFVCTRFLWRRIVIT